MMADKALPSLPTSSGRAPRSHLPRTLQLHRPHSSTRPGFHASRPLSPVSEIPYPSETQTLQLEINILHQQLTATKRRAEEGDQQVAALEKENHQYRHQI